MKNHVVTFTQEGRGHGWRAHKPEEVYLCDEEFRDTVDLPNGITTFEAVFVVKKPAGDNHFGLVRHSRRAGGAPSLNTRRELGLMGGATELIGNMHDLGYRYMKVQY